MQNLYNTNTAPGLANNLFKLAEKSMCRGKQKDTGEWIEGFPFVGFGKAYICPEPSAMYFFDDALCLGGFIEVDPATVGRYIGMKAKGDKRIFERDRLEAISGREDGECLVGLFVADLDDIQCMANLEYAYEIRIIGNIYDDPEPDESADDTDDQMQIPF